VEIRTHRIVLMPNLLDPGQRVSAFKRRCDVAMPCFVRPFCSVSSARDARGPTISAQTRFCSNVSIPALASASNAACTVRTILLSPISPDPDREKSLMLKRKEWLNALSSEVG
jgi:hypothetical protein